MPAFEHADKVIQRDPSRVLANWLHYVLIAARTAYPGAGLSSDGTIERLMGMNEVGIVLAAQLRSLTSVELAYPMGVLLEVVIDKAELYGCRPAVEWAWSYALGGSGLHESGSGD